MNDEQGIQSKCPNVQDADYDFSVFQRHPTCSQPFTSSSGSQTSGRWVQVFPSFTLVHCFSTNIIFSS